MRLYVICTGFFLFFSLTSKAQVDQFYNQRFRQIIRLVEKEDAVALSKWVAYPLKRSNPLPDIASPAEFISRYHTLFDSAFKSLLKQYKDQYIFEHHDAYGLVGGPFSGEIWMNEKGKIQALNYSSSEEQAESNKLTEKIKKEIYPDVNEWTENVLVARSDKLLLRVDRTEKGLRYACWSKGKPIASRPDIILYNGVEEQQGTMGGWTWTFTQDDWLYVVNDAEICDKPSNCGLFLELYYKEKLKSSVRLKAIK